MLRFHSVGGLLVLWLNLVWGFVLGAALVAVGARLWNRRPLVIAPRAFVGLLALAFVPVLVGGVVLGWVAVREGNFVLLLPLLLPVGALVLVLVFFRQVIGRAVVMNVDEDTLYDSLEEVLDRHGMSYREGRSTIDVVEHEATVEINYQATTNSGTVNARGDDQRDLFPVLEDLRSALRDKPLAERSRLAAWYVALGTLIILSHAGLTAAGVFAGD